MKLFCMHAVAVAFGAQMAFAAGAAAQVLPVDDTAALAATLSSALAVAQGEHDAIGALLTPEHNLEASTGLTLLAPPPPRDANRSAVDASAATGLASDAVARVSTPTTYEELRAIGKRNEKAAYKRKREAGRYDPPLQDEKGYYFDVVQTWNYRHTPGTDDVGLHPPEYYAALRCRAAPRTVGPLADNPNWKTSVFWRVCPDEAGRYRPTL